jgi:hypothetical protein
MKQRKGKDGGTYLHTHRVQEHVMGLAICSNGGRPGHAAWCPLGSGMLRIRATPVAWGGRIWGPGRWQIDGFVAGQRTRAASAGLRADEWLGAGEGGEGEEEARRAALAGG